MVSRGGSWHCVQLSAQAGGRYWGAALNEQRCISPLSALKLPAHTRVFYKGGACAVRPRCIFQQHPLPPPRPQQEASDGARTPMAQLSHDLACSDAHLGCLLLKRACLSPLLLCARPALGCHCHCGLQGIHLQERRDIREGANVQGSMLDLLCATGSCALTRLRGNIRDRSTCALQSSTFVS